MVHICLLNCDKRIGYAQATLRLTSIFIEEIAMRRKKQLLHPSILLIVMVALISCTSFQIQAEIQPTIEEEITKPEMPIVQGTASTPIEQIVTNAVATTVTQITSPYRATMVLRTAHNQATETGFLRFAPPNHTHVTYMTALHGYAYEAITIDNKFYENRGNGWQSPPGAATGPVGSLSAWWLAPALAYFIWDPPAYTTIQYGAAGEETIDNVRTNSRADP